MAKSQTDALLSIDLFFDKIEIFGFLALFFFIIMAAYPPNEIVDMIRILGEARNNYSAAERLYAERFPDRRHPDRKVIKRLCYRAEQGFLRRNRRKSGPDEVTLVWAAEFKNGPQDHPT